MATILRFKRQTGNPAELTSAAATRTGDTVGDVYSAEIIIFPGVRIERDTDHAVDAFEECFLEGAGGQKDRN